MSNSGDTDVSSGEDDNPQTKPTGKKKEENLLVWAGILEIESRDLKEKTSVLINKFGSQVNKLEGLVNKQSAKNPYAKEFSRKENAPVKRTREVLLDEKNWKDVNERLDKLQQNQERIMNMLVDVSRVQEAQAKVHKEMVWRAREQEVPIRERRTTNKKQPKPSVARKQPSPATAGVVKHSRRKSTQRRGKKPAQKSPVSVDLSEEKDLNEGLISVSENSDPAYEEEVLRAVM